MSSPSARTTYDPAADGVNPYQLLTAIVVPRPIAWVSTLSADGVGNLAPHSFFTVVSADPPIVAFASIGDKDTLANALATREFTISVTPHSLIEDVNDTSASFAPDADEAAEVGIATRPSVVVAPPSVAGSPAAIECTLHSTVDLGQSTLVLGTVVSIGIDDDVLVDGRPSYARLDLVSRLGGSEWGLAGETVTITRPGTPEDIAARD